jgi:hypothetical protein
LRGDPLSVFDHARFEPFANQSNDSLIGDPMLEKPEHPPVIDFVEGHRDTIPIISSFPNASPSRVHITRFKDNLWRSFAGAHAGPFAVRAHFAGLQ